MLSRGVPAAAAAVAAFFFGAVLPGATWPLTDGDAWWHIRAGEEILRTGAVSHVDAWSIVGAGRSWTSQDWLSNVLMAAGHSLGPWGDTALSLLFGAFTVTAFWIAWRAVALRIPQAGWASRIGWLAIGLLMAGPVLGARVQVLDLLLASAVLWICWRYLVDPRRRWLAGLPLVAVLWANLHAGWVLLFLIGGAVLAGEAVDRLLRRAPPGAASLSWPHLGELAVALLVAVAALVVNPNGVALYGYPFATLGISALGRYILEWSSASLATLPGQLLAAFTVLVVLPTLLLGWRRTRAADALILVGLTLMAFQAIRFLLIVGPIGAAIAAVTLSPIISARRLGRAAAPTLERLSRRASGARGAVHAALAVAVIVIGVGIAVARVSPSAQASAIARGLPVAAVAWLDEHEPGTRMFNRYEWGGYIGQHRPRQAIFMDGRADVYGDQLLQMYGAIIGLDGDPQIRLDRYRIDYAIYAVDTPLASWFDASASWRRVYADDLAAIWVRR